VGVARRPFISFGERTGAGEASQASLAEISSGHRVKARQEAERHRTRASMPLLGMPFSTWQAWGIFFS